MQKILEIEISTNNRNDHLFKFLLPSFKNLVSLKDLLSISINFNNNISEEKQQEAVNFLENYGFEVHYKYNQYIFKKDRHAILSIRNDCDKINEDKKKYIFMVDDDIEYFAGFDRQLLMAINAMEENEQIGLVHFRNFNNDNMLNDYVQPANTFYCSAMLGGLLIRRNTERDTFYPKDCIGLYGPGEEQIWTVINFREKKQVYFINSNLYKHEQHWKDKEAICGCNYYPWEWAHDKFTISWKMDQYRRPDGQFYWVGPAYWLNKSNIYDFSKQTFNDLFDKIVKKEGK